MRNDKLLSDLIQDAVTEYSYETHEDEFSAVVEVRCVNGWTQIPDVVFYDDRPRIYKSGDAKLPFWITAASLVLKAAINAVARVPADVTPEVVDCLNKTVMELSTIQQKFEKTTKNAFKQPDN